MRRNAPTPNLYLAPIYPEVSPQAPEASATPLADTARGGAGELVPGRAAAVAVAVSGGAAGITQASTASLSVDNPLDRGGGDEGMPLRLGGDARSGSPQGDTAPIRDGDLVVARRR